jgi:acetyl esterase/lipase
MKYIRHAIAAMGQGLGPAVLDQCRALFDAEQVALAQAVPVAARDLAYGPHERHRLDLYASAQGGLKPVLLFVHGGGFVLGDKGDTSWPNAAVGRMAARRGWIGAVMNYRLAPDHMWPAGSEDVAAAVDYLRAHVAQHGGDPERIIVMGTSAGAVHVSGFSACVPIMPIWCAGRSCSLASMDLNPSMPRTNAITARPKPMLTNRRVRPWWTPPCRCWSPVRNMIRRGFRPNFWA